MQHMDALSRYNPSPLTMQQLVEFGKTATEPDSFHFLKKEVPVRLANIMKEINLLPSILLAMPSDFRRAVRGDGQIGRLQVRRRALLLLPIQPL